MQNIPVHEIPGFSSSCVLELLVHWITCDLFQVTAFVLSATINLFAL